MHFLDAALFWFEFLLFCFPSPISLPSPSKEKKEKQPIKNEGSGYQVFLQESCLTIFRLQIFF